MKNFQMKEVPSTEVKVGDIVYDVDPHTREDACCFVVMEISETTCYVVPFSGSHVGSYLQDETGMYGFDIEYDTWFVAQE